MSLQIFKTLMDLVKYHRFLTLKYSKVHALTNYLVYILDLFQFIRGYTSRDPQRGQHASVTNTYPKAAELSYVLNLTKGFLPQTRLRQHTSMS